MPIKKMIYATKFRELSHAALSDFLDLQKVGLEEIILLHVIQREEVAYVPFGGFLKEKALELRENALLKFQNWEKDLVLKGFKVKKIVEIGDPITLIVDICEREKGNLLVIGKKKSFGPFTSEITSRLVTKSPIPVIVYRKVVQYERDGEILTRENTTPFRRILISTDFSEVYDRMCNFVLKLAPLMEKVFLMHVIKKGKLSSLSEDQINKFFKEVCQKLEEKLELFRKNNIEGEVFYCIGDPVEEILEFAREKGVTLITLGKTGKGVIKGLLLGSVSKNLIKSSEIPLLIVP